MIGLEFLDGPADVDVAGGPSFHGAIGMLGNVWEWEEGNYDISNFSPLASQGHNVFVGGSWTGGSSIGRQLDLSGKDSLDIGMRVVMVEPREVLVGDFNRDGAVNASDLDLFDESSRRDASVAYDVDIEARPFDFTYNIMDLNKDNFLNDVDRELWLTHVADTTAGDSDLDGDVDFGDFLALANGFGQSPSSWSQGDFDGNDETNFLDFLALANNFGNASGANVAAVPEPSSSLLALLLVVPALMGRKRRAA